MRGQDLKRFGEGCQRSTTVENARKSCDQRSPKVAQSCQESCGMATEWQPRPLYTHKRRAADAIQVPTALPPPGERVPATARNDSSTPPFDPANGNVIAFPISDETRAHVESPTSRERLADLVDHISDEAPIADNELQCFSEYGGAR